MEWESLLSSPLFVTISARFSFPDFPKKLSITFYYFLKLSDVSENGFIISSAVILYLTLHSETMSRLKEAT